MNLSVQLSKREAEAVEQTLGRMVEAFPGTTPSKAAAFRSLLFEQGRQFGQRFINAVGNPAFMNDLAVALAEVEEDGDMRAKCLHLVSAAYHHAVEADATARGIGVSDTKGFVER
ncbi:MAG: hypothetical protein OXO52_22255 [Rhodospirillales bacterium]|nr:hypothetical protein [Rhodospirillales bacterium]MDE0380755.1 hypothetical protein [Rhodospirillales bacterium]